MSRQSVVVVLLAIAVGFLFRHSLELWWEYDFLLWWRGYPDQIAGAKELVFILWLALPMVGIGVAAEVWDCVKRKRQRRRRWDD